MAPSAALQARIRQFEGLDNNSSTKFADYDRSAYPPRRNPQPQDRVQANTTVSPPPDILGEPLSPTASQFSIIQASVPYIPRKPRVKSPSPSPPNLGCNTSLIDLKDWVVEDAPRGNGAADPVSRTTVLAYLRLLNDDVLLQLRSSIKSKPLAPPLPPRLTKHTSKGTPGPSKSSSPSLTPPNGLAPGTANTLTVEHTYPPLASQSNTRQGQGHVHASSTSSFHSVSLSSDGGTDGSASVSNFVATYPIDKEDNRDVEKGDDPDRESIDESFSFETVSSTSVSSPSQSSTHDWEKDFLAQSHRPDPPKLPSRNRSQPFNAQTPPPLVPSRSTPTVSPQSSMRRVPPPPVRLDHSNGPSPSNRISTMSTATSASDRSSIFSTTTVTTTHTSISNFPQLLRPTPVPEHVRKRYERVFATNETAQNRIIKRNLSGVTKEMQTSRKGWRGLSVDLITALDDAVNNEIDRKVETPNTGPGKLDGRIIRRIWGKSRLPTDKLRDIWYDLSSFMIFKAFTV